MQRAIHGFGKAHIGRDGEEDIRRLHRSLILVKIMFFEDPDMVERAFDQRLGARLTIFFEQILFQAAGIDADAYRAAIGLGRRDHFADPLLAADIARVDPQARSAGIGSFKRTLVVEVDIGDDRHARGTHDLFQCVGRLTVGTGDADNIDAGLFAAADLIDRRLSVRCWRVGHRLHRDRRIAADRHIADHDLARLTPDNIRPGARGCVFGSHAMSLHSRCPALNTGSPGKVRVDSTRIAPTPRIKPPSRVPHSIIFRQ